MGLSFTIAADPRQRSHSRVRVPRGSWTYFTVSDSRLPQPGRPGPHVYIPQEEDGPVIPTGTGFLFRRLLLLAGLWWRYSNPPPHGLQSHWLKVICVPILRLLPLHEHTENTASHNYSVAWRNCPRGRLRKHRSQLYFHWLRGVTCSVVASLFIVPLPSNGSLFHSPCHCMFASSESADFIVLIRLRFLFWII
jgi:hypothetical protein